MAFREVGGVGGDFVGNQPLFDILFVGQAEMLFRRDIAQHGAAEPADHCRADTGGEMVVARRDISGERPQGVERRFVAVLQLFGYIAADHLHRHVAGPSIITCTSYSQAIFVSSPRVRSSENCASSLAS